MDIQQAAGNQHLSAGQGEVGEAAVHGLRTIFDSDVVILVDVSNTFNRLTWKVAPTWSKWAIYTVLHNTYQQPAQLFVDDQVLLSDEGTTQGDPLSMAFYALATVPLAQQCKVDLSGKVWFADDAAGSSSVLTLHT